MNLHTILEKYAHHALMAAYLLLGLMVISDYGISMDEPIQRKHGIVSFEYVNERLNLFPLIARTRQEDLQSYDHREYGVFFQLVAYTAERMLKIDNARDVFLLRHVMTFLLFWTACYFFALTLRIRFEDWKISLAGLLFLILSPRIFADAFYNPKDIPFLAWTLISFYTLVCLLRRNTVPQVLLHACMCALAMNARVTGVFLPVVTLGLMLPGLWGAQSPAWRTLTSMTLFLLATVAFTVLFWPFLWENPVDHFGYAFQSMKRFHWYGNVRYLGDFVPSTALPWHYVPVWIAATTPVLYTILFVVGTGYLLRKVARFPCLPVPERMNRLIDLAALAYFFVPLFAVVVFRSVLYNGWRHVYFIYPAFLLIAVNGLFFISGLLARLDAGLKRQAARVAWVLVLFTSLSGTAYQMIRLHPFQQVYFNALAGKSPHQSFDMEYYGLSYRHALAFLLNAYPEGQIRLHVTSPAGLINQVLFSQEEIDRLKFVPLEQADFMVTNYSFPSQTQLFEAYLQAAYPFDRPEIYSQKFKNSRFVGIYDLK